MLLISTAITKKLDFQELGDGREKSFGETCDEVERGPQVFSEPIRRTGKLTRAPVFNHVLFGYFIVFFLKEKNMPPGDDKHLPVPREGLLIWPHSRPGVSKIFLYIFCTYFGLCRSRGNIKDVT